MKVYLNATDHQDCVSAYEGEKYVTESQICAGGVRGHDTCRGDSGGPLQTSHHDAPCVYDIVGLTSYGSYMCGTTSYGIYTKISAFLDWIEKHVWEQEYTKWVEEYNYADLFT
jgi:secreted trypsin-like serine protease